MCWELMPYFQPQDQDGIQVLLNTTSFSPARLETPQLDFVATMMCRCCRSSLAAVQLMRGHLSSRAFTRDIGMNVALPEVDGRILAVRFL